MDKKITVLTLGDHPLSPTGVGTQTKYMIESLLKTGKFKVISLAGAIKHQNYQPIQTEEYGDLWTLFPVDGFGDEGTIRSIMRNHKPDILWFMTDPRFYGWLWNMSNEVRCHIPMVYYHVWDNKPYPTFNRPSYESTDVIATISKVTADIIQNVAPSVEHHYIPHSVNPKFFKPFDEGQIKNFRKEYFEGEEDKFIVFWNNRNARRKQPGTLIHCFKAFLDRVGHDKAKLLMHTNPKDENGPDLEAQINALGLVDGQVAFSTGKYPPDQMSIFYNLCDCTINISDAEGFGLGTLESLACKTPIIVNMTGGLQEQVTDGENFFGVGIEPAAKAIIGSQSVPFIYEDRVSESDVVDALVKLYEMTPEERQELGNKGYEHVQKNYSFENFEKQWADLMLSVHENYGSWGNRKNYQSWDLTEL